ncbi:Polycomb group RING finger protein 5 [Phytophthora boehmeriae]|uniref:Polycomb group RING finger protein 5 n=1 Tax=Phytophthora boehmeriae TaxID=109152 RepID=A0A8T1X984_9STRA|nr:Polycomb group RING finger protein 5 [Phytophthora boehmeriae]
MGARTVTVKLAELTEHLGCALCKGILRDAHTIPDCLHSFCKSCIYRHFLVKGSRLCPKCNMMLSPRPIATLISDKKLQDVVDRIFPEYKAQEEIDEREFYTKNKFKLKDNTTAETEKNTVSDSPQGENMSEGSTLNSAPRSRSKTKKPKIAAPISTSNSCCKQFTIEVYPQQTNAHALPMLKFPFMQVNGNFKMSELRKLIHRRLRLADDVQVEVACMGTAVGPELSVHFILRTIWQHQNQPEPLVLHYRHATS